MRFKDVRTLNFTPEIIDCLVAIRVRPGRIEDGMHWIEVQRRDGLDGTRWAVWDMGLNLNHDGDWEREPQPSSRDDAFLARCRFDTFAEAVEAALRCKVYTYRGKP